MPVKQGKDKDGCYAKWGDAGFKYYYKCDSKSAETKARKRALAQGLAIGDFIDRKEIK